MRKKDKLKPNTDMATKTLNFEVFVLKELERLALVENTSVSKLVNSFIRDVMIKPKTYYQEMAKYHQKQSMMFRHNMEQLELIEQCQ